jgi:hypothetical protein
MEPVINIAIPSVNRASRAARTLEQLDALQGRVNVRWYVRKDQAAEYRRHVPGWQDVISSGGLINVAVNNILSDYAGADVVMVDDDIPWYVGCRAVFAPRPGNAPKTPKLTVLEAAQMGFGALDATGLHMWGQYPVPYSGTALKPRIGVGTVFLPGATMGVRVPSGGMPFTVELAIKQDYEMSAKAIDHWGAVVRLDLLAAYTVGGGIADGSMGGYRTPATEGHACQWLQQRWPHLFTPRADREGLPQVSMVTDVQWHTVQPEAGWHG